jgi:hypothetical protein
MRIRIDRAWKKKGYTISRVIINGERFGDGKKWCSALEDEDRGLHSGMSLDEIKKIKVYGKTAIPKGVYEVRITYSPRFKKRLPLLIGVKGFDGVRFHPLNRPEETEGCIGFGVNDVVGRISNSKYWCDIISAQIEAAEKRGERVWIEVG